MRLSLDTREVGRVTIVRCKGRIVSGGESESLRTHVAWLLRDRRSIVLHLGEVAFVDSSGLGTMVRTLTSTRTCCQSALAYQPQASNEHDQSLNSEDDCKSNHSSNDTCNGS